MEKPQFPGSIVVKGFIVYTIFTFLALIWSGLRGDFNLLYLTDLRSLNIWRDSLMGAGSGLAVVLISRVMHLYVQTFRTLNREFKKILGPLSTDDCLLLSFFSAIGEELFFRGAMQPAIGLVLTSLIFGLMHIGGKRYIPWTISAMVLGFVLGAMADYSGNLLAPFIAHFTINYFNLLFLQKIKE